MNILEKYSFSYVDVAKVGRLVNWKGWAFGGPGPQWPHTLGRYKAMKQPHNPEGMQLNPHNSAQLYFSQPTSPQTCLFKKHLLISYMHRILFALRHGFLSLSTTNLQGWRILCVGDCPVHCWMLNCTSTPIPAVMIKNVSICNKCPIRGKITPKLKTTDLC